MPNKPFLIDAIIGNGQTLVTMGKNGQFQRYFWPNVGGKQHLSEMQMGVKISNHHETSWIHDHHWEHSQKYLTKTNIVRTIATNTFLGVKLTFDDFVLPENDVIIRDFTIENLTLEKNISMVSFSSFSICGNPGLNSVLFDFEEDMLVHYRYDFYFGVGSNLAVTGYQCGNNCFAQAQQGNLIGGEIGMVPEGALNWDLGNFAKGEKKKFTLFICPGKNLDDIREKMRYVRSQGAEKMLRENTNYWQGYLKTATEFDSADMKIKAIYNRSLLVFRLLSDKNTGGILAAPEIDEGFCRCGGYGYCWGRDAAFITVAMDKVGYHDLARNFYNWALKAQASNGAWLQRYHIDGSLAPSWGLQIDEVGSIIWGMWQHYLFTNDREFLDIAWPAVEKAVDFMISYLDGETNLPKPSYDLWEERRGEHAYSSAAVYGGFKGAVEIAMVLGNNQYAVEWERVANAISQAMQKNYWDESKGRFIRTVKLSVSQGEYSRHLSQGRKADAYVNPKGYVFYQVWADDMLDISLLGLTEPFEVLPADDARMRMTVNALREKLTVLSVGGIKRYENDSYIGGNPWIITTLWMALYLIRLEDYQQSRELFYWAVDHCTDMNLLPEQVDKHNGQPAWVIPLTWSHAMFVLTALALKEKDLI